MRFVFLLYMVIVAVFGVTSVVKAGTESFEGVDYRILRLTQPNQLEVFWKNEAGTAYATFPKLEAALNAKGRQLTFAMNGGIYEGDLTPTGLHIENGKVLNRLDTKPRPKMPKGQPVPNFWLTPNGVFYVTKAGKAGVMETEQFRLLVVNKKLAISDIKLAVQSGPLLLKDGTMHPDFRAGSPNKLLRNAVGVNEQGHVIMISTVRTGTGRINFETTTRLFRKLGCKNALFLDGDINQFYLRGEDIKVPKTSSFAAILAITEPLEK